MWPTTSTASTIGRVATVILAVLAQSSSKRLTVGDGRVSSKIWELQFKSEVFQASLRFDRLIRQKLRELTVLDQRIASLSDNDTAQAITGVDQAQRDVIGKRIRNWDEATEAVMNIGGRVVKVFPAISKGLEELAKWVG
jgi:hypothetical protein